MFVTEERVEKNNPTYANLGLLELHSCSSSILIVFLSPGMTWHQQVAGVSSHTTLLYSSTLELMNLSVWKSNPEA